MKVIKNIIKNMKKRLAQADCDIDLALQYKNDYPEIAKVQYNASVEKMNQFRSQQEAIVQLISNFKKEGHEVLYLFFY